MADNAERAVDSKNDRVLPVVVSQVVIFPMTILKNVGSFRNLRLSEPTFDETKYLVLKDANESKTGPSSLWKVGVVSSLRKDDGGYFLIGESRAEVIKVWRDRKDELMARVKELEDIPTIGELTNAEMPMLFGCVDSIRLFLIKWREKVPKSEEEHRKKVSEQINKIETERREVGTIYSLPWHILVNFPSFFSLDFKEEMLKTNKVIDRLLSIAEKLQQEVSVSQYAESFADADTEGPIRLENGVGGK